MTPSMTLRQCLLSPTGRLSLHNQQNLIQSQQRGKSCDDDGISAEHFFNAPFSLFQRLQTLINSMLRHGFVPKQFRYGTIVPIVKDHQGNLSDPDNYRGITMSPIVSKIPEHTLRMLFSDYLSKAKTYQKIKAISRKFCFDKVMKKHVL